MGDEMSNQGAWRSCSVGAKMEAATARSGHLQKELMGLPKTGHGLWERQPSIVKKEMGSSRFKSWFYFLLCDLGKVTQPL